MTSGTVPIARIKLLGSCFKNNSARVLGHDGAYSIPLSSGKVFWSFGDTLIGSERRGYNPKTINIDSWLFKDSWARKNVYMISNSGLIADTERITDLMDSKFEYFVHKRTVGEKELVEAREIVPVPKEIERKGKERTAFWPVDGIEINRRLYFFYLMVTCEAGPINLYGTGLARSISPYETFERLPSLGPPPLKTPENPNELQFFWWDNSRNGREEQIPAFGTAVLKEIVDNYIYIYGSRIGLWGNRIAHTVSLARVKKEDMEDITKYEYLSEAPDKQNDFNSKWEDNPQKATSIFEGNANELSVTYNPYLDKYVSIYSHARGGVNVDDEIHMRTSSSPAGPWGEPSTIFKPQRSFREDSCYAGKEHPEYRKNLGKTIYVTYVSHQRYFPELLEIEFE